LDENYHPDVLPVRTSARVHVYPQTRFYPRTGFTVHGRGKNPSARTLGCVHVDMARPCGRTPASARTWASARGCRAASARTRDQKNKIKNLIFFGSCGRLGKREIYNLQFSVFNPQNPQNPHSPQTPQTPPSSVGFAGEATRRKRFFQPSSPNHPSKLYSSLGWLNSKVPKPFPPFSLRLIDVDGF
jgi:hypothetical protein